jgi:hypothetical protein
MARASREPKRKPLTVRSDDEVQVIAGKEQDKRDRVLRVEPVEGALTPRRVLNALADKQRQLAYNAGYRGRCQRIHDHREGRRRGARRPHTRQPGEGR